MASKKTAALPYNDWPGGGWHSIPYAQELARQRNAAGNPLTLPAPPQGTYDSSLDYNAGAAKRGYQQFGNDAQTQFEQGQEDYTHGLGLLDQSQSRLGDDYHQQTADLGHQYGILGHQQAEHAAQQGITSQGLLAKSTAIRGANQTHDQMGLETNYSRGLQDIGEQRSQLGLADARTFGGFNGTVLNDPYTGQPVTGSLLTQLQRAGTENTAYQAGLQGQMISGAQANGFISPLLSQQTPSVSIGKSGLSKQQYQQGLLVDALLGGRPRSAAGL